MYKPSCACMQTLEVFLKRPNNLAAFLKSAQAPSERRLVVQLATTVHALLHLLQQQAGPALLPASFLQLVACSVLGLLHAQASLQVRGGGRVGGV